MEHKGTVRLETGRLILRPFRKGDGQAMYENWASDPEVTRYLTWPTHTSAEVSENYVEFCVSQYEDPHTYQWGIVLKETGELIGNISSVGENEVTLCMEIGWVIGRKWWGQGIMPEAAAAVLDFLFNEVKANRIMAGHDSNNPKSGRVMQKIGMRYEGRQRKAGRNNQGLVDMDIYAILKEDLE